MAQRRRSSARQAERKLYAIDRALGDYLALRRGPDKYLMRLARRNVRRRAGRRTRGWL